MDCELNKELEHWESIARMAIHERESVKDQGLMFLNTHMAQFKEQERNNVPEELMDDLFTLMVIQNATKSTDETTVRLMSVLYTFLHQYTDLLPLSEDRIKAVWNAKQDGRIK